MALTVGSYIIANTGLEYVALTPLLGGYELLFGMKFEPQASRDKSSRKAVLHGGDCLIKASSGLERKLGFARFNVPVTLVGDPNTVSSAITVTLHLSLSPQQLAAIEDLRAGGDLTFELTPAGDGQGQAGQHFIQDTWRRAVPKSEWIQQLRISGAADILLIEVPIGYESTSERGQVAGERLRSAQLHFYQGDYPSCVATCRTAIAEVYGPQSSTRPKGVDGQTKPRRDMTKAERESDLVEAVRNYTHLAHHAGTEGGESNYSRAEARLMLTVTAAIVARAAFPD